jgi:hypothetical protein
MVTATAFTIRHFDDSKAKGIGWGLIKIEEIKTYRVELDNFELIPIHDEKFKEFEELLKLNDEYYKSIKHIKTLAYGKTKEGQTITLILIKDNTKDKEGLTIIAYDFDKAYSSLKAWVKRQQDP